MTALIDDKATAAAAKAIQDTLVNLRQHEVYGILEDVELAIISRRANLAGRTTDVYRIIYGMPCGQALEAIRQARNAIAFEARLSDLFNGKIYPAALAGAA